MEEESLEEKIRFFKAQEENIRRTRQLLELRLRRQLYPKILDEARQIVMEKARN